MTPVKRAEPLRPPRPLRVVTTLPELKSYRDRALMIAALAQRPELDLVYLLTVEGQAPELCAPLRALPKLKLIEAPRRGYLRWLTRWLNERLDAEALEVVHDCFGHLAAAFERPEAQRPSRRYALLTVQYTTNWGWFERVMPLGYDLNLRYAYLRAQSLWLDARVARAADRVVTLGPGHERDLIEGHELSPHKLCVIPAEIDSERFRPLDEPETGSAPSRDEQLLLYTGALSRNKGLDLLLALFASLSHGRPQLKLCLIGRVPPAERRWLQDALKANPARERIETLEPLPQEELIPYYQRAWLYLFPSLFEGSPRSLREALACGCLCVASELPGCRGADPHGDFIYFAPPRDLELWSAQVSEALRVTSAERARRVRLGLARMRAEHSPEAVASRYLSLYHELLAERAAAQLLAREPSEPKSAPKHP